MKTYVINLREETERKASMTEKLKSHGIDDIVFFDAVNGKKENLKPYVNRIYFKQTYKREMSAGEQGCAMSHVRIAQKIVEANEPAIVFEDDIYFLNDSQILKDLEIDFEFDVIFLNGARYKKQAYEYKGEESEYTLNGATLEKVNVTSSPLLWWLGSSYILSPEGAKKVIAKNYPIKHVADAWFMFDMVNAYHLVEPLVAQDKSWGSATGNH